MRILLALFAALTLVGCSETESVVDLSQPDLSIRFNELEDEIKPEDKLIGAWILQRLDFANEFSVFSELHWLRDIQELEVADYLVTLFLYPNGKWHVVLATIFADNTYFDTTYLVGEYMVSDTEFMISGGRHGCFNVDRGTYTVNDYYLTLRKKPGLSALIFEKIIVEEEPEPESKEPIRLWD